MKKLVFLTGAGVSAESGFSTFRDAGGLWEQHPVEEVCTCEGWMRNPTRVNNFYNGLREQLIAAKPNAAHEHIAALEADFDVTVITQNVDDLHERAGSSRVVYLHGELMKACSSRDKENPFCLKTLSREHLRIDEGERAADGSLLRPYIVFFGEAVPRLEEAARIVEEADIFVIVGSSLVVYPAAGLLYNVRPGVPIYLIDPKDVEVPSAMAVTVIQDVATRGMARLAALLKAEA
ncbi:MAG: NAD-dependent deacylase [Bacteroidales bacterium]|nr:NAD-dependent deacylase [Candidatus Equimonas enterica]